jgi:hypothetical protein
MGGKADWGAAGQWDAGEGDPITGFIRRLGAAVERMRKVFYGTSTPAEAIRVRRGAICADFAFLQGVPRGCVRCGSLFDLAGGFQKPGNVAARWKGAMRRPYRAWESYGGDPGRRSCVACPGLL